MIKTGLRALFFLAGITILSTSVWASAEEGYYVSAETGLNALKISGDFTLTGRSVNVKTFSIGVSGGYQWQNNFLVEAGISAGTGDVFGIFDDYSTSTLELLVGYSFQLTDKISFKPKVGYVDWKLIAREGIFLNPGPENELVFRGGDSLFQINFELDLSDRLDMYLNHDRHDSDYGSYQSTRIGIIVRL